MVILLINPIKYR